VLRRPFIHLHTLFICLSKNNFK